MRLSVRPSLTFLACFSFLPGPSAPSTIHDTCLHGVCAGVDLCLGVSCDAPGQCFQTGICDYLTGNCTTVFANDGAPCNDNDATTVNDSMLIL